MRATTVQACMQHKMHASGRVNMSSGTSATAQDEAFFPARFPRRSWGHLSRSSSRLACAVTRIPAKDDPCADASADRLSCASVGAYTCELGHAHRQ